MGFGFFFFVEAVDDELVDGEFGTEEACAPECAEIVDADDEGIVHEILVASFGYFDKVFERLIYVGNILRNRCCDDTVAKGNVGMNGCEVLVFVAKEILYVATYGFVVVLVDIFLRGFVVDCRFWLYHSGFEINDRTAFH